MSVSSVWSGIKSEVEFLNNYPILLQATTDNDSPVSGYLLGEINALTHKNNGLYCKQLVKYFISKAQGNSSIVKYKALRILLHIIYHGHDNILQEIKLHEVYIKEIDVQQNYSSIPGDNSANAYNSDILKMKKDLLTLAFSETFPSERLQETTNRGIETLTGYGAHATVGKFSGFGSSATNPENFGEQITEGFNVLVEKILSPTSEDDFYKKQATILSDSLPKFKPIIIKKNNDDYLTEASPNTLSKSSVKQGSATKKTVHIAGKAGGGWDSDDDDDDVETIISLEDSIDLNISIDSLENKMPLVEYVEEQKLVEEFAVDLPLEEIKYAQISSLCKRCLSLNCEKILEILVDKLSSEKEFAKLRCLIMIEYLLQRDIVNVESLLNIVIPKVKTLSVMEKCPVQTKSKKICLIVENLNKISSSPKIQSSSLSNLKSKQ